MVNSEFLVAS